LSKWDCFKKIQVKLGLKPIKDEEYMTLSSDTSYCYVIAEMHIIDHAGFEKDFPSLFKSMALKKLQEYGGQFIVKNTNPMNLKGRKLEPVMNVLQFDSVEKAIAAYGSPEMKQFDKLAKKYVKIRRYILNASPLLL